ncbi:hypothetical protein AO269_11605 [Pseudomonas putida]|nr:hypothetical protein AO269_11605 [Pseudomonas putida]
MNDLAATAEIGRELQVVEKEAAFHPRPCELFGRRQAGIDVVLFQPGRVEQGDVGAKRLVERRA